MMKKLLILGEFPPKTRTGVSISNQRVFDLFSNEQCQIEKIEEYSWDKKKISVIFHYIQIYFRLAVSCVRAKFDIFYFTIPLSVFAQLKILPGILIVKLLNPRSKFIAHIHRGDFDLFTAHGKKKRLILKTYLRLSDSIIVLSEKYKSDVRKFFPHKNIQVLANTSDFETGVFKNKEYYTKEFICVANYIESKGIEDLVRSFQDKELESTKLTVYGSIYDSKFYKKLKEIATPNVKLKNELSRNELIEALNKADCLIVPSWNEGQPISILEAMSLSIPVIATQVGDIPNMLGKNYEYIPYPKNFESIREKILLFHHCEDKREIREYLYNRYKQFYSNLFFEKTLKEIFNCE